MTGLEGNTARVKAADGGMVSVDLVHGPSFDGQYYEFDGIVQTPDQIREVSRASFGSSFSERPSCCCCCYCCCCSLLHGCTELTGLCSRPPDVQ